jgi:hypothetical protein
MAQFLALVQKVRRDQVRFRTLAGKVIMALNNSSPAPRVIPTSLKGRRRSQMKG